MFYIDYSYLSSIMPVWPTNPLSGMWFVFSHGGWILFLWMLARSCWDIWMNNIQGKFLSQITYVFLAIDIPKLNEQNLKAMEQIFAHLCGSHSNKTFVEKYWLGHLQPRFSFEIVSIDGHIQFLVRTPTKSRDLVEAAIYAQYPEAEIEEVADYTGNAPQHWPDDRYKMWGCEIAYYGKPYLPIRTYPSFEYTMDQKMVDPMSALLESLSRMKKGEQLWLQFIVTPFDADWYVPLQKELEKKLLGKKSNTEKNIVDKASDVPLKIIEGMGNAVFGKGEPPKKQEKAADPFKMMNLSPGEKDVLTAAQNKLSKIGMNTKIRMIYIAPKETFNKALGASAILGAFRQFNTQNLNGFKPVFKTQFDYWFTDQRADRRRNKIMRYYKGRDNWAGAKNNPMNIEELATICHFPLMLVKAPMLQKTESKKGEPPMTLPVFEEDDVEIKQSKPEKEMTNIQEEVNAGSPPPNLPI